MPAGENRCQTATTDSFITWPMSVKERPAAVSGATGTIGYVSSTPISPASFVEAGISGSAVLAHVMAVQRARASSVRSRARRVLRRGSRSLPCAHARHVGHLVDVRHRMTVDRDDDVARLDARGPGGARGPCHTVTTPAPGPCWSVPARSRRGS